MSRYGKTKVSVTKTTDGKFDCIIDIKGKPLEFYFFLSEALADYQLKVIGKQNKMPKKELKQHIQVENGIYDMKYDVTELLTELIQKFKNKKLKDMNTVIKKKKPKKKRAEKYDTKLKIHGSFEDAIKILSGINPSTNESEK